MKHTKGQAKLQPFISKHIPEMYKERISINHDENSKHYTPCNNYIDVFSDNLQQAQTNAKQVVRAWNSHDQLVNALKRVESELIDVDMEVPRYITLALRSVE